MSRFRNNLYTVEAIVFRDHAHRYIRSDDGTLFSNDRKTKILVADLPEWYVYGRYHKRFGYMSTKGITDLRYVPNKFTNHYLKDDSLYVAYGGKIEDAPLPNTGAFYDRLIGYDDIVWGGEIISVLRGAQIYSNYDISSIVEQLKEKKEWLVNEYPDEFGPERWDFDVDACFSEPFDNGHPQKYYAITLDNYFTPSIVSSSKRYYGTLQEIESFIDSLDQDQFSETVNAFRSFKKGKKAVTHHAAYAEKPLLKPVTLISENYQSLKERSWDFINIWDCIHKMKLHTVFMDILLIKDGDEYIRCIKPKIYGFCYHSNAHAEDHWEPVHNAWGHPGIVLFDDRKEPTVLTSLFLPEKKFSDVKAGVNALYSEDISLDPVCEDIFADG